MFDQAGDVRLTGYAGTNSYDFHVAVSPLEHIGFVGAGSWSFGKKIEPADKTTPENEIEWSHSHRYFEGAVAFYLSPFSLRKDMMKIEVLAGYGSGIANASLDAGKRTFLGFIIPTVRVDAKSQQYYIQVNAAVTERNTGSSKNGQGGGDLEYGSIFRFSKTRYYDFVRDNKSLGLPSQEGNFIQIGAFGTLYGNELGLTTQIGWLYPLADDQNRPSYSPLYATIGLNIYLW